MNKDTSEIFKAYASRLVTESAEMCSKCHKPCSVCSCSECNCSKSKEENNEMAAAETNAGASREQREIEIGNQIVSAIKSGRPDLQTVLRLAYELIKMHQVAPEENCEVPMQPSEIGGTHEENAEEKIKAKFPKKETKFDVKVKQVSVSTKKEKKKDSEA